MNTPLELDGSFNARCLGGFALPGGRTTKPGVFIRAGSLHGLTEKGKATLLGLGINCILDLRSRAEIASRPDTVLEDPRFVWHNLPMLDSMNSAVAGETSSGFSPRTLEEMYVGLLKDSRESFRQLFALLASPECGGYLIHCAAGKDRTGIAVALILSLAGASPEDIIADYSRSEGFLREFLAKSYKREGALSQLDPSHPLIPSPPQAMVDFLYHLNSTYGGGRAYLEGIGVSPAELDAIAEKFTSAG